MPAPLTGQGYLQRHRSQRMYGNVQDSGMVIDLRSDGEESNTSTTDDRRLKWTRALAASALEQSPSDINLIENGIERVRSPVSAWLVSTMTTPEQSRSSLATRDVSISDKYTQIRNDDYDYRPGDLVYAARRNRERESGTRGGGRYWLSNITNSRPTSSRANKSTGDLPKRTPSLRDKISNLSARMPTSATLSALRPSKLLANGWGKS